MNNKFQLFAIATVCLRASLYTLLEKCRLPSRWPHYEGRQEKPSDCSGKVARVHFEEWNGNTQKGTDAGEKENKNVPYCEDEQGTKHLRRRSGASAQVGKLLFFFSLLLKNMATSPTSTKHLLEALVMCINVIISVLFFSPINIGLTAF